MTTNSCRSKRGPQNCPYHGKVYTAPSYDRTKQSLAKAYTEYSTASMRLKHEMKNINPDQASALYLKVHNNALQLWEAEDLHDSTDEGYISVRQQLEKELQKPELNKLLVEKLAHRLERANLIRETITRSEKRLAEARNQIEASRFLTKNQKIRQLQQAIIVERANIETEKTQYKIHASTIQYDPKGLITGPNEQLIKRNLVSYAIVQERLNQFGQKIPTMLD